MQCVGSSRWVATATTYIFFFSPHSALLHDHITLTPRLSDDISLFIFFSSFISTQYTCSPQTLFYNNSLQHDPQRPPSFASTCTKSKLITTNSFDVHCTTSQSCLPFLLTSSQLHTHFQVVSLVHGQSDPLTNLSSQSKRAQSHQTLTIFWINL